jgi:hypothetical protein
MPGLATRVPREAYEQMRRGNPVLCGNLAEIYVALCEAAGLTARAVGLSVLVRDGLFGIDTHAGERKYGSRRWVDGFIKIRPSTVIGRSTGNLQARFRYTTQ